MGAFAYSEEQGTPSAKLYEDNIPEDLKQKRLSRLMRLQQRISAEVQEEKVGKEMTVVIDRQEDEWYVGRTEYDSPEVDPEVLIACEGAELTPGTFCRVTIDKADDFDLFASVKENM